MLVNVEVPASSAIATVKILKIEPSSVHAEGIAIEHPVGKQEMAGWFGSGVAGWFGSKSGSDAIARISPVLTSIISPAPPFAVKSSITRCNSSRRMYCKLKVERERQRLSAFFQHVVEGPLDPSKTGVVDPGVAHDMEVRPPPG